MPKKTRLVFYPGSGYNGYIQNMQDILSQHYEVVPVKKDDGLFRVLKIIMSPTHNSIIVLNWIENAFFRREVKKWSLWLAKIVMFALKLRFHKVVYFRHNDSPHGVANRELGAELVQTIVDSSDHVLTHNCTVSGDYIPHPLYRALENSVQEPSREFYLVLGTVREYKGLHYFLKQNQDQIALVIAGKIEPDSYEKKIKAFESKRVTFIDEFLRDGELQQLVRSSKGVIVINESRPLVSGSFIYAFSMNKTVHCLQDNYLQDLQRQKIANRLKLYDSYQEMIKCLRTDSSHQLPQNNFETFTDKYILERFISVVESPGASTD